MVALTPMLMSCPCEAAVTRVIPIDRIVITSYSIHYTKLYDSVQEAAAERGIQLVYDNAEQKQENQIKALRSFIAYQVDVIA